LELLIAYQRQLVLEDVLVVGPVEGPEQEPGYILEDQAVPEALANILEVVLEKMLQKTVVIEHAL
jgi:hypothetical protein